MDGFGVNYDGRSKIMPRGIVKANAVVDNDYLKDARSRLRNAIASVGFKGEGLTIEGNEMFKVYNDEPIVIHRGRAAMHHATGKQSQPFERSDAKFETRVPVVGTLNGALGKTKHDILEQFAAFGVAENADRLGQTNALNAVLGGFFTVPNGPKPMIGGDYVMIDCPEPGNPASFPTRAVAGNIANRGGQGGRIPFFYTPYRPLEISWYQPDAVMNAIKRNYELVKGKKTDKSDAPDHTLWIKSMEKPSYSGVNQSYLSHRFTEAVKVQVEALTSLLRVGRSMNNITEAGTIYNVRGGTEHRGQVTVEDAHEQEEPLNENIARDAAIRIMLAAGRFGDAKTWMGGKDNDIAGRVETILKANPFQLAMRAQAQFRLRVEEWVIGRAVTGAGPYNDFDLHMRGYGN
jgi:hypothetical protein